MPPVNPQSSRGGLVGAVVVFTVLFVTATIFAIYYGVQDSKAEDGLAALSGKFRHVAIDITSPEVSELISEASGDNKLPESTALAEAIRQRDSLRQMIVGSQPASTAQPVDASTQTDVSAAISAAQQAITDANTVLAGSGGDMSAASLIDAVGDLKVAVQHLNQAAQQAVAARDVALKQAAKDSQAARDAQAKANTAISQATEALQQQLDAANDAVKKAQDESSLAKKTFEDEQQATSAAMDAADKQHTDLTNEVSKLNKDIAQLSDKLAGKRLEITDPIIRRPEGQIIALGDADTVYINVGEGDQIVPGMTFEVYDKTTTLPKLGDGQSDEDLPRGKASIEVTKVLPNGSECHVSRLTGGQVIVQGDPILNLIYDRNVKFRFFVYGDFDIARNGHPTAVGGDVVRRLVQQWGGSLDAKINPETDFVVVGTPPELPVYTAEDLKDPLNQQTLANAQRAVDDYDKIVDQAEALHIPILNQNKFLFFTGYYDLALR
jgi:predicted  nucleic acid-binding Zn-ribbon protein